MSDDQGKRRQARLAKTLLDKGMINRGIQLSSFLSAWENNLIQSEFVLEESLKDGCFDDETYSLNKDAIDCEYEQIRKLKSEHQRLFEPLWVNA
jgi:hypothetical protein